MDYYSLIKLNLYRCPDNGTIIVDGWGQSCFGLTINFYTSLSYIL